MQRIAGMLFLAASLCASAPALAQDKWPLTGTWAWDAPKACETGRGADDLFLTITDKKVSYYASECTIRSKRRLAKTSATSYRLKLRCSGEGETRHSELILGIIESNEERPELLVHIDPADGSMRGYRRCSE
jgi:hypothetical protein